MTLATQTAGTPGTSGGLVSASTFGNVNDLYRTPGVIANQALYRLMPELFMPLLARKHYQNYFNQKIGTTIQIKRPYATKVARGRTMVIQEKIERLIPLTVDERWHWATSWTDEDMTFSLKNLNDDYLETGIEQLGLQMEDDGLEELTTMTYLNSGTPGTGMTQAIAAAARDHAVDMMIPRARNNYLFMDPTDITSIGKDVLGKGSAESFAQQLIRERYRGNLAQFHVIEVPLMPAYEVNNFVGSTIQVVGANQTGSEINIDGFANADRGNVGIKKGTIVKFQGVNEVQPRTLRDKGRQASFTVTEDATVSNTNTATLKIEPELNDGTMTLANVGSTVSLAAYKNVTRSPGDNANVTIVGTKNKTYRQSVFWQQDCMDFISIGLAKPIGLNWGQKTERQTGITMSVAAQGDIKEATSYLRVDCVWVFKCLRPDLAVRVVTGEV